MIQQQKFHRFKYAITLMMTGIALSRKGDEEKSNGWDKKKLEELEAISRSRCGSNVVCGAAACVWCSCFGAKSSTGLVLHK